MRIKIRFAEETRFDVPNRQIIRTWTQRMSGTRLSFRALAMTERPKRCRRKIDWQLVGKAEDDVRNL
jgi:hypothetical protein